MGTNVLVIDSGGRGDALTKALTESRGIGKAYIAPGNGGTAKRGENVNIPVTATDELLDFAEKHQVDLILPGTEESYGSGIVDCSRARGIPVFGPSLVATELEKNKAFMKLLARRVGIPTADFEIFTDFEKAWKYLTWKYAPPDGVVLTKQVVIKEVGFAGGKGSIACFNPFQASAALKLLLEQKQYGGAGVVVEDFLGNQPEVSFHFLVDSAGHISMCPTISDHKKNHAGEQTGGVGTISPTPWIKDWLTGQAVIAAQKILAEMKRLGRKFTGLLYPGFMLTKSGDQWVLQLLEVNVRFGDSECQTLLKKLKSDFLMLVQACINGALPEFSPEWHDCHTACLILYAEGYPGPAKYGKGQEITGVELAEQKVPGTTIFHAGTAVTKDGKLVTAGGRVLGITTAAPTLELALAYAYEASKYIDFKGKMLREDIGREALLFKF